MIVSKFPSLVYVRDDVAGRAVAEIWHQQQWTRGAERVRQDDVIKSYPLSENEAAWPIAALEEKYPSSGLDG